VDSGDQAEQRRAQRQRRGNRPRSSVQKTVAAMAHSKHANSVWSLRPFPTFQYHGQKSQVPRAKTLEKSRFPQCTSLSSVFSLSKFCQWKQDANLREIKVMRRYHLQDREDYHKYNKLAGSLRSFAHRISLLPAQDPFRSRMEAQLLAKLYDMGILNSSAKLSDVDKITVAAFCRRRLAVYMCMNKMAETVSAVCPIPLSRSMLTSSRQQNLSSKVTSE